MTQRIGVISNPLSGHNKRHPDAPQRLASILGDAGEVLLPEGLDALRDATQHLKDRGISVLGIHGGDGTIHQVMTALHAVYGDAHTMPTVALLRAGTMNTIARNVGVRSAAETLLRQVVEAPQDLTTTQRCLMIINDKRAGFIFANAGIAHFLQAYYDGGDSSAWKAAKVLTRASVSSILGTEYAATMFRFVDMDIRVDGQPLAHTAYVAVGVCTVADLGFGFQAFYQTRHHPEHLHLIGIAEPVLGLTASLPRIRLAMPTQREHIEDHIAKQVRIQCTEPVAYTIDGDLYTDDSTLTIRAGPAITFLVAP